MENRHYLDGKSLTLDTVEKVLNRQLYISLAPEAADRMLRAHSFIQNAIKDNQVIYGVTTGFGSLANRVVDNKDTATLQLNLIRSHAIGTGPVVDPRIVRCMLLLRVNCIASGCSGVSAATVRTLLDVLNKDVLPEVFEQGSVGASGDLVPLSHMVLGLLGEGRIRDPADGIYKDARAMLDKYDIAPLRLGAKEGLALNNGTQFITSYLVESLILAKRVASAGIVAAALTLEMLHGTSAAYDERIHAVRPHSGQVRVAEAMRHLLLPKSAIALTLVSNVQEAYSLRCVPQIQGTVLDLLEAVQRVVDVEINSVNDNPLLFVSDGDVVSGGNFHGQYPAVAADQLALAMTILANVSERRLERLVNGNINICKGDSKKHLPSFLVDGVGLNSGTMILQYQAAGLVAENRHLAAPSCVHSIPTCENTEDMVSMGGWSARKALLTARNTARVVAAELYAGALASHYTEALTTPPLQRVIADIAPQRMTEDRYFKAEVDRVVEMVESGKWCEL